MIEISDFVFGKRCQKCVDNLLLMIHEPAEKVLLGHVEIWHIDTRGHQCGLLGGRVSVAAILGDDVSAREMHQYPTRSDHDKVIIVFGNVEYFAKRRHGAAPVFGTTSRKRPFGQRAHTEPSALYSKYRTAEHGVGEYRSSIDEPLQSMNSKFLSFALNSDSNAWKLTVPRMLAIAAATRNRMFALMAGTGSIDSVRLSAQHAAGLHWTFHRRDWRRRGECSLNEWIVIEAGTCGRMLFSALAKDFGCLGTHVDDRVCVRV